MSSFDIIELALDEGGHRPLLINIRRHIQRSSLGLPGARNWESSTTFLDPDLRLKPSSVFGQLDGFGGDPYILRRAACYLAGSRVNQPGLSTRMFDPRV